MAARALSARKKSRVKAALLITDLEVIARRAKENRDDYEAFRYFVEEDARSDAALDRLVAELAAPIVEAIDCTTCANCCQKLNVYLTPADADRLTTGLNIPLSEVTTRYLDHFKAGKEEEWGIVTKSPCPFLRGKLCGLYEYRPETCRSYPEFTPDFRWQLSNILAGAGICPIIFNTIEAVKQTLKW